MPSLLFLCTFLCFGGEEVMGCMSVVGTDAQAFLGVRASLGPDQEVHAQSPHEPNRD